MVSLAESGFPSSSQGASSSTSGPRRSSHARSMGSVRSNLYLQEDPSCSHLPVSTAVGDSPGGDLTDSVVDASLRELCEPVEPDSLHDLLELSRDDRSAFSSLNSDDVSRELQRLASTPGFEPPPIPPRHDPCELHADGFWSSPEILESASPDSIRPLVAACVECLRASSSAAELMNKREAAAKLRLLAKQRSDFRALIGSSGAIPPLIPLLRSADPLVQENAVTALFNLSLEEPNKAAIAAAGAVKPLVYALRTGTAAAKQNAACALLSLAMKEENRGTIGACGAIPPLVALLVGGSTRGKKDALTALYKLCSLRQNKERAVAAGAVAPLVGLAADQHGAGTTEKALVVLNILAGVAEGREAIVEAGGMAALVEAVEEGSGKAKEFALLTLLELASAETTWPRNRGLLVREGAIPPLVALTGSASARLRHKAEKLLGYLREQRQQEEIDRGSSIRDAHQLQRRPANSLSLRG